MPRDPSRQIVPEDGSLARTVLELWKGIQKNVYDDTPYTETIRIIENAISEREVVLAGESLNPTYDWAYDLELAKFHHRFNLDWLDYHQQTRQKLYDFWKDSSERQIKSLWELSLNGYKMLYLIHGAVALGSLNALTIKNPEKAVHLAAQLGLFFALLGIFAAGLGQLILVREGSMAFTKIHSVLYSKIKWKKLLALGRYSRRRFKFTKIVDILVYGSVFWFCIYTIILYVVLIS